MRSKAAPAQVAVPPAAPVAAAPVVQSERSVTPSPAATPSAAASPFEAARRLIADGRYEAGIAALRALGSDDDAAVAAHIGLANQKLRRADEAKSWFERALAADPNNLVALAGDGALLAEQGHLAQAMNNLEKIRLLCGVGCAQYSDLDRAIAGSLRTGVVRSAQ